MARPAAFEWYAKEYEFAKKSADWYWAVGIIAVGGAIAAVIFANFLLAILIVVAAGSIGLVAAKPVTEHRFSLTEQGLEIDDRLYHYDTMMHFSVLEYLEKDLPPALSIKTRSILTPHLLVPLDGVDPDEVYEFVLARVEEGRHDQSVIDRLVDMFQL